MILNTNKAKTPIIGVGLILLNEFDEVLVSQRFSGIFERCWQFPGGKLECFESFHRASMRELMEETGICLQIEDIHYLDTFNTFSKSEGYHFVSVFNIAFVQKNIIEAKTMEPHKSGEWKWVKWEEFVRLEPIMPIYMEFISKYKTVEILRGKVQVIDMEKQS